MGDKRLEVRALATLMPGADARPRIGAQAVGRRGWGRRRGSVRVKGVIDFRSEIGGEMAYVRLQRLSRPIARFGGRFGKAAALGLGLLEARLLTLLAFFRTLEQRIARQFVLDELGQLEIRHLQQLDRLQKLRRQNDPLTLPQRQFRRERHS